MNSKKYILIGFELGILFVLSWIFFVKKEKLSSTSSEELSLKDYKKIDNFSKNMSNFGMENYVSIFDNNSFSNANEFTDALRTGKINFIWELWALREKCPSDSTIVQCNNMILSWIDEKFPPPGNEEVKKLFLQYFEYEAELVRRPKKEGSSFEESYEELKKLRREHFKPEEAELVFGMEEAEVDFMRESKEFIDKTKNMKGEQRVKEYEKLKKKIYGSFYEAMVSREEKFDHYQMELSLREKELSSLGPEQKEAQIRKIQEKYFGKEGAQRIAQVQKEEEEYRKKISDYEQKEANFLKENSKLKPEELQKKLTEFRIQNLGQQEAEMYTRRKMLEEYK